MLEEAGRVVALGEGIALVETIRSSSCQSCSAKSACGQGAVSKVLGQKSCVVTALNTLPIKVGDEVVLGLEESTLIKSALLVYLFPLLLMIVGALLMQNFFGTGDFSAAVGGGFGLLLGFSWVYRYNQRHRNDSTLQPVVLKVAESAGNTHRI